MIEQIPEEAKGKFQKFIEKLLNAHGLLEQFYASEDFHVTLHNSSFEPLSIEHHGNMLAIAHYYKHGRTGELMPDPDIQFDLPMWEAVNFTDDFGYKQKYAYTEHPEKGWIRSGIYRSWDGVVKFMNGTWLRNLRSQKWIENSTVWTLEIDGETFVSIGKLEVSPLL